MAINELEILRARVKELEAQVNDQPVQQQIASLKETVRKVAEEYAREYELCPIVDEALRKAGIKAESKKVEVNAMMYLTLMVEVDGDVWDEMTTDEERHQFLAENLSINGSFYWPENDRLVDVQQVQQDSEPLEVYYTNDSPSGLINGVPRGYVERYMVPHGRVKHFVRESEIRQGSDWIASLCDQAFDRASNWTEQAQQTVDGRRCAKCVKEAAKVA